jgi:hypothetical protein
MLRQSFVAPALVLGALVLPAWTAESDPQVLPERSYRLDLPARKPDEKEFTRGTRTVSVDVFLDEKAQRLLYVGDDGKALAAAPAGKEAGGAEGKTAKWVRRLLLPVRPNDEKEFGKDTPMVGVEVYRDERAGHWVYVSHTGGLAVLPAGKDPSGDPAGEPRGLYRLPLRVRPGGEFEYAPRRCNVEVYRDDHAGALVYVAESGALAVVPPGKVGDGQETVKPAWSHGLVLKTRKPGEDAFGPDTMTRHGVEIYQDENRVAWVYLTETLHLAVLPGSKAVDKRAKDPVWLRGLRPPGGAAKKWSAEVYNNPNAGHVVTLTTGGAVAVVPSK